MFTSICGMPISHGDTSPKVLRRNLWLEMGYRTPLLWNISLNESLRRIQRVILDPKFFLLVTRVLSLPSPSRRILLQFPRPPILPLNHRCLLPRRHLKDLFSAVYGKKLSMKLLITGTGPNCSCLRSGSLRGCNGKFFTANN